MRTALGYGAIWCGNIEAVKMLIRLGVDVKQAVAEDESSSSTTMAEWTSAASRTVLIVARALEHIPLLLAAGARKADWDAGPDLYNVEGPGMLDSFWKSGGDAVTQALRDA
jgi:hypothetical protein